MASQRDGQPLKGMGKGTPHSPEALISLGDACGQDGDLAEAIRYYRKALVLDSQNVIAHTKLANCLLDQGDLDLAEFHAQRAHEFAEGRFPGAARVLAIVAERRCDPHKAISILGDALKLHPDHPNLLAHLGTMHSLAKQHETAIELLNRALKIYPGFVDAMNNLSSALFKLGRLDEAEDVLLEALRIDPQKYGLYFNLANIQLGQKRHVESIANFNRLFEKDPHNASGHFICGMAYLGLGDFANGWREYAWRWRMEEYSSRVSDIHAPQWQGEYIAGKVLLVHSEQGIGDTLQFARYIPLLERTGARIVFSVPSPLKRLMARLPGIDRLIVQGETLPHIDFQTPLLNLPGILGTTLETIPGQTPYLSADGASRKHWQAQLNSLHESGLKIGIAWAGNPAHENDRNRSMSLAQLAPLATVKGVRWISLQKGERVEAASRSALDPVDWTSELYDYEETAALIDCLDLILAVDTSVVHLAGSLNKPVWVMIPYAPDWRWLLDRADSPWYPSMRLFRQGQRGNWSPVVESVVQSLKQLSPPGPHR